MFDRVAGHYDGLNHLLSLNLDRVWRRRAASWLETPRFDRPSREILDLCGGTGDLTTELARRDPERQVLCCDFSPGMLAKADRKFSRKGLEPRCRTRIGDALDLPFGDESFDAATVAFGVRNLADRERGFRELARILRPGGRLVVLEFSQPVAFGLKQTYDLYLRQLLPRLGDRISGADGAYGYLARTIGEFPGPDALAEMARGNGFESCAWERLTGGIVAIHAADKAAV